MKVLGQIRLVCDARTIMYNGNPIVKYPIIFDAGESEFVGDMYASQETLTRRGVKPGAVGHMEIEFRVREAKRATGDTYPIQSVRFKDFRLANAGIFNDNAPAASGQETPKEPAKVEKTNQSPIEAEIPEGGLTF